MDAAKPTALVPAATHPTVTPALGHGRLEAGDLEGLCPGHGECEASEGGGEEVVVVAGKGKGVSDEDAKHQHQAPWRAWTPSKERITAGLHKPAQWVSGCSPREQRPSWCPRASGAAGMVPGGLRSASARC